MGAADKKGRSLRQALAHLERGAKAWGKQCLGQHAGAPQSLQAQSPIPDVGPGPHFSDSVPFLPFPQQSPTPLLDAALSRPGPLAAPTGAALSLPPFIRCLLKGHLFSEVHPTSLSTGGAGAVA